MSNYCHGVQSDTTHRGQNYKIGKDIYWNENIQSHRVGVVKCQIKSTGAIMGSKLYFLIKKLSRTFMMIAVFSYIAELGVN